jgi:hypothetical protein
LDLEAESESAALAKFFEVTQTRAILLDPPPDDAEPDNEPRRWDVEVPVGLIIHDQADGKATDHLTVFATSREGALEEFARQLDIGAEELEPLPVGRRWRCRLPMTNGGYVPVLVRNPVGRQIRQDFLIVEAATRDEAMERYAAHQGIRLVVGPDGKKQVNYSDMSYKVPQLEIEPV